MTNEEIWAMLRRGGFSSEAPSSDAGEAEAEPSLVGRYNPLLNPAEADQLGVLLAEKTRTVDPNVIVVGEGVKDLVLGFIVARELGMPIVRVMNLEGLVGSAGALPVHARAAFVADRFRKREFVSAVYNLLDREGGELVAVVSLVVSPVAQLPVEALGLVTIDEGLRG